MKKDILKEFGGAMAYIEVLLPNGDITIGSAFHIGEGVFVTARHVVDNVKILSFATTQQYYEPNSAGKITIEGAKYRSISSKKLTLKSGPHFHPDNTVDVAILVSIETDIKTILLGSHLDDWINDQDFILTETLVMGYPPIPFSKEPLLFAASAEINAVIDKYNANHPHFIVSVMPRGGFSGGVCLIGDCALGVIVESLISNNKDTELGYLAVLTVEPIFVSLQTHNLVPEIQKEAWNSLWD